MKSESLGEEMRVFLALLVVSVVGGCLQTAGSGSAVTTSDGVARKLAKGITPSEASVALGPDAGFERNPENWDEACISYNYGSEEAPKYVHAVFVQDALVRATDGHLDICAYGQDTAS